MLNISINPVAKSTGRVSTSSSKAVPRECCMWQKNPSWTRTARTARIHAAAATGYFFHRSNGRSVEYAIPSNKLPARVARSGGEPVARPIARDAAPVSQTTADAKETEKSPAASGKYGLLILSISISYIWFIPTMLMFIRRAEISAWLRAVMPAGVMPWKPIARNDTETTETKVPSMVWGRVNRYKAGKRWSIELSLLALFVVLVLVVSGSSSSGWCAKLSAEALAKKLGCNDLCLVSYPKGCVDAIFDGFRRVFIAWEEQGRACMEVINLVGWQRGSSLGNPLIDTIWQLVDPKLRKVFIRKFSTSIRGWSKNFKFCFDHFFLLKHSFCILGSLNPADHISLSLK